MATGTSALDSRVSAKLLDSKWTNDLSMSDAEFLLDQLEMAGFRDVEVRCTHEELFAIRIPWTSDIR